MPDMLVWKVQDGEWVPDRPQPLGAISQACITRHGELGTHMGTPSRSARRGWWWYGRHGLVVV